MTEQTTFEKIRHKHEVTGRTVLFGEPGAEDFAWGIEVDIPVDLALREGFADYNSAVKLPPHVKNIKYLIMNPEENLPKEDRIMKLPDGFLQSKLLEEIVHMGPDAY